MDFQFEIYGEKLIARKLLRIGDRARDLSPAFDVTVRQMLGMETALFDSEGASSGRPWAPVAPSTLAKKIAAGLDHRTLHMTLRLRRSLTERGATDQIVVITPSAMAFGSSVPYAGRHQRPRTGTARRPLDFSESNKRTIIKGLQEFVVADKLAVL